MMLNEAKNLEAKARATRPRPGLWCRGRGQK